MGGLCADQYQANELRVTSERTVFISLKQETEKRFSIVLSNFVLLIRII